MSSNDEPRYFSGYVGNDGGSIMIDELEALKARAEEAAREGDWSEMPRYTVRDAAFALQPVPERRYLVADVIEAGKVIVFVGPYGAKKTRSTVHLAVCCAGGKPWLGNETQQTNALLLDEEMGETEFHRLLHDTLRGELLDETTPVYFISMAGFDLRKPEDVNLIHTEIVRREIGLVIIDALRDVMPGGNENDAGEVNMVFHTIRVLSNSTGATFVVLHHVNKQGKYSGSTAIPGSIDGMINVTSEPDSPFINFASEKRRYGKPLKFSAYANFGDGQFWLSPAEDKLPNNKPTKAQRYVLDFLDANQKATIAQIADELHSKEVVRKAISELVDRNMVRRIDPGKQGITGTYALNDNFLSSDESK